MWKDLLGLFGRVWRLAEDNDKNKAGIQELRREIDELADQVKYLAFEVQRTRENERHEREKLALALQNELLRFERRLPPPRKG